jgi:hypothetical protein
MKKLFVAIICCLVIISEGCTSFSQEEIYNDWDFSTPTRDGSAVQDKSPTPSLTITQSPTVVTAIPKKTQPEALYKSIYAEELNTNWDATGGNNEEINLRAQAKSQAGFLSIAIIPTKAFNKIDFKVKESTKELYPRAKIIGLRFWIHPEDYDLSPSNLSLKLIGSNNYTYFKNGDELFSVDTTLDSHGYNQSISANTWTELTIWMENLNDEIDYNNLVGFSFINDSGTLQTIYLDQVELILPPGETIPTRAPTSTYTMTPTVTDTPTITPTPTLTPTPTPTKSNITPYWTPTPTRTKKPSRRDSTEEPLPTVAGP